MTEKPEYTNREKQLEELLHQFPDEHKTSAAEIWKRSAKAAPGRTVVTETETERALRDLHHRIPEFDPNTESYTDLGDGSSRTWRWLAAAAIILLTLGAGYLLIPQTASAPYGEMETVKLPDGSTVQLNSGSQIRYNRLFAHLNRDITLDGEAFFSVRSGDIAFSVETNNSTVTVTGTKFNVRSWSSDPVQETEVTVAEGRVTFSAIENPDTAVTLKPGQLSKLSGSSAVPSPPKKVAVDRFTGWRHNNLIFNEKSLAVIFRELERRFDVNIDVNVTNAHTETLTTYYADPGDVESILEDICRVKGLNFAKTANGYRVY
ncbi:MAG: FecR domain-containing protein [Balneolaceae bacterium]|nr:FecR domain-containing protein [Balneolaceae bacterium]